MYCSSELIKACRLTAHFAPFSVYKCWRCCMCKDVWYILRLNYDSFIYNKRNVSELILFIAELILSVLFYFDVSIIT